MSETGAEQFDAAIAPLEEMPAVRGQLGPQIVGSGTMSFQGPGDLHLYYTPQTAFGSSVTYANNSGTPSTPVHPKVWTTIQNIQNLNIAYQVSEGSDLKLAWAISNL